jgi:hypothetical protein
MTIFVIEAKAETPALFFERNARKLSGAARAKDTP